MTPELRAIPKYPEYGASADGRIWRLEMPPVGHGPKDPALYPRALKPSRIRRSLVVPIPCSPYNRKHTVASLVAAAWLPKPRGLRAVRFIDGDRENCAADNLTWGSRKRPASRKWRGK